MAVGNLVLMFYGRPKVVTDLNAAFCFLAEDILDEVLKEPTSGKAELLPLIVGQHLTPLIDTYNALFTEAQIRLVYCNRLSVETLPTADSLVIKARDLLKERNGE